MVTIPKIKRNFYNNPKAPSFVRKCKYLKPGEKLVFASLGALSAEQAIRNDKDFKKAYKGNCKIDIKNTDEEQDIFDPEFYEAYYGIDLNIAKSRAFRDRELFNPNRDDESLAYYSRYDNDDIPLASNLFSRNEDFDINGYEIIDTDFGSQVLPLAVTHPWASQKDDGLEIMNRYEKSYEHLDIAGMTAKTIREVLPLCYTEDKDDRYLNFYLVRLAAGLFINNNYKWGQVEKDILEKVNESGQASDVRYKGLHVARGLANFLSNGSIYKNICRVSDV